VVKATKAAKAAAKREGAPARKTEGKRAINAAVQIAVVKSAAAKKSPRATPAAGAKTAAAPASGSRQRTAGSSAAAATARVRAVRQPKAASKR
jgi:hypothetical protein